MLPQLPGALLSKPAPEGGSGFQLCRHHSRLPPPCSLQYCGIGDAGAAALGKMLEKNTTLQVLE